jgi:hypothetical protein
MCTVCNKITPSSSGMELDLYNYIKSIYSGTIIRNTKRILPSKKELDIYLPDINMAFEFNGLYWHSDARLPKDYHYNKANECDSLDIDLIQIFENVWLENNDKIKKFIFNRIYTNILEDVNIKEIEISIANEFLESNHILGSVEKSDDIMSYAVFKNEEILSLLVCNSKEILRIYNMNYIKLILNFINSSRKLKLKLNRLYYNSVYIRKRLYMKNSIIIEKYNEKYIKTYKKSKKHLIYNAGFINIKI